MQLVCRLSHCERSEAIQRTRMDCFTLLDDGRYYSYCHCGTRSNLYECLETVSILDDGYGAHFFVLFPVYDNSE
jgi:hypothetical protein